MIIVFYENSASRLNEEWFQFEAKSDTKTCPLDSRLGLLTDDEFEKVNKPVGPILLIFPLCYF